jgi:hypothetical protein
MLRTLVIAAAFLCYAGTVRAEPSDREAIVFISGTVRNEAQAIRFFNLISENEKRVVKLSVQIPRFEDGIAEISGADTLELVLAGDVAEGRGTIAYNVGLFGSEIRPNAAGTYVLDGFYEVSEGARLRGLGSHVLSPVKKAKERTYNLKRTRRIAIGN